MNETSSPRSGDRLQFVDNLRIFLTVSVIVHHAACTYGPLGSWYYYERPDSLLLKLTLVPLVCTNQAYFMGFFFLLSGTFTALSLDRKGPRKFLKERFTRLGIPLVVFSFLVQPCLSYPSAALHGAQTPGFIRFCWERVISLRFVGPGPLWFVATLLLFDCGYVAVRSLWPSLRSPLFPLGSRSILKYALGLLAASFAVRIWFPADTWIAFFQLAFYPQYISLFILGVIGSRNDWGTRLPDEVGRTWLRIALIAWPLWYPVGLLGGALRGEVDAFKGGIHWQAFLYSCWECLLCVGLCSGLIALFRRRFNQQGPLLKAMSQNVYAVYILHAIVLVSVEYGLSSLHWPVLLKFFLACGLAVPATFLLSHYVVRRLPLAKRIL